MSALELGADDFLTKPFSPRTLLARIRALLRRAQGATPVELSCGSLALDRDEHTLAIGHDTIRLTALEVRFVQLLMTSPARTVRLEHLLQRLWGGDSGRERNALKQLVYRLRLKIELQPNQPAVLQTSPNAGYRLVPPEV